MHLTQIVGNKIQKVDLCENCAQEKGVTDPAGFSLTDLLPAPLMAAAAHREAMVCEQCGFSPKDFKKLGRFGCPSCYEHFSPIIEPMLKNMHRDTVHRGKVPDKSLARVGRRQRLQELENDLQEAVSDERFEDAATLRDEISRLRESIDAEMARG